MILIVFQPKLYLILAVKSAITKQGKGNSMKKIICLVITLLMTLPAYAKLTAHEEARINAMLEGLSQKKDLIFVRNGDEHTCDEAVSHLRLKLGNTRNRIDTAEQFIDKVASSSSITGKPYIVKIPGKSDENAQPFLHALIAQTDKTVPAQ